MHRRERNVCFRVYLICLLFNHLILHNILVVLPVIYYFSYSVPYMQIQISYRTYRYKINRHSGAT